MSNALFATFCVDAIHLPLLRSKTVEELQIALAEKPEEFKRGVRIGMGVVAQLLPDILIVRSDVAPTALEHLAVAPGGDHLTFGEMCDDLRNRPFSGLRIAAQGIGVVSLHQRNQIVRSLALDFQWIFAVSIGEDTGFVLVDGFSGHKISRV